jgi:hypothetical protein
MLPHQVSNKHVDRVVPERYPHGVPLHDVHLPRLSRLFLEGGHVVPRAGKSLFVIVAAQVEAVRVGKGA